MVVHNVNSSGELYVNIIVCKLTAIIYHGRKVKMRKETRTYHFRKWYADWSLVWCCYMFMTWEMQQVGEMGEVRENWTRRVQGILLFSKNIQGLSFIIISEMILHHFQNDTKWGRQSWPRYGVVYMPALSPPLHIIYKMILYHFQNDTKWGWQSWHIYNVSFWKWYEVGLTKLAYI